ncbi:MAG: benzoate-CoA ligase family protein [Alphaproteobacteria bacterium]|nr:benzoate-CoA ligase family protein [Alphaproteobacteria bacterium]
MRAAIRSALGLLTDHNLDAGRGARAALITSDGRSLTFDEVHALSCRFAGRLLDQGVRREQRVLLIMDDSPAFWAAFLGAARIGAVPVPLNFLAREEDFRYFLEDSYAALAVVNRGFLPKIEAHAAALGVPLLTQAPAGEHLDLDDWLRDGPDHVDHANTHAEDMAFWLYSSGSTGRPKGVVHAHKDVAFTCERYAEQTLQLSDADRTFSTTKLFHAYGLGNGLTFPLYCGATAIQLAGRPTPDACIRTLAAQRPTVLFSVPALYNAMLADPALSKADLSALRLGVSAAEALPPEVWRQWRARTGTEILDGIGSTEMLHIYCSNRPGRVKPGSSGAPVPGYALQLRDGDSGEVLSTPEAVGDLWVKGGSALAWYWHNQAKTRAAFQGEWFFTGDRYRRAEDGSYTYEGRADDMIKVKGLWVSPIAIENRLIEHAQVREAAVVGVSREGFQRVRAYVILEPGSVGDEALTEALQAWCKEALLRYQYPHEVVFVEDFPRTATGKVQRFRLRDQAAAS